MFLGEHPWCQHCQTAPSVDVHHAVPHRGNVEVFWDMSRWVALCKACHGAETAREMNGPGYPGCQNTGAGGRQIAGAMRLESAAKQR